MRLPAVTLFLLGAGWLVGCSEPPPEDAPSSSEEPGGGAAPARAAERPMDVLLVTLDTTRADRLPIYGGRRAKMPALEALAAESTVFERAYTAVPSTLPSHCSIMTGLYPEQHGVHDNGMYCLPQEHETLAEVLEAHGWNTAAFVAAFVLDRQFQLDQGFDIYDDQMLDPLSPGADPAKLPRALPESMRRWYAQMASAYQRSAEAVTHRVEEWLDQVLDDRPFFLWVHYFDPHEPYTAPGDWETRYDPDYDGPMDGTAGRFAREMERRRSEAGGELPRDAMDRDRRHMIARYDGELSALDEWIGRLREALERRDRWRDTLVIVVGDHGEAFGEHGQIWEHAAEIFEEVVRVPLLVRPPGGAPVVARAAPVVRTIDLMPTVLDFVGIEGPPVQGSSLRPLTSDAGAPGPGPALLQAMRHEQVYRAPFSYLGLRDETGKTVVRIDREGQPLVQQRFDLEADPRERRGAASDGRDVFDLLRGLEGRRRELPLRPLRQIDTEALRALGYMEPEGEED